MANYSMQLQADNLPIEDIGTLLVAGPWAPVMSRMRTGENILLEGCRGAGKTMLMRATAGQIQNEYMAGGNTLGVHATFKRYLATLPPPTGAGQHNDDLANFRAWVNARILSAVCATVEKVKGKDFLAANLPELGEIPWDRMVSILETTYRGHIDAQALAKDSGISFKTFFSLQGYTYTLQLLRQVVNALQLKLLIILLDDAAHALDTRAQGAFFTAVKSLYDPGLPPVSNYCETTPSRKLGKIDTAWNRTRI